MIINVHKKLTKCFSLIPILLAVAIIGVILLQGWELMTRPIHADEAEHAHSAYLLAKGKRQLVDFFQHHLPGLWYLLIPYYWLGGYGAGVLLWGRVICFVGMLLSTYFCFKIGRVFGRTRGGLLAALFFLPFGVANQYLLVRPECVMLPMVLAGIWFELAFLADPERKNRVIWGAVIVGLSLFFSPRSLVVLMWIWIVFLTNRRLFRQVHYIVMLLASLLGLFMAVAITGWHEEYSWIFRLPMSFQPPMNFNQTWTMLTDRYVLVGGFVIGGITLFSPLRPQKYLAALLILAALTNLGQALTGSRSPSYAWAVVSALVAIILAYGVVRLYQIPSVFPRSIAGILVTVWLISAIRAVLTPALMLTPDGRSVIQNPNTLMDEIREMDGFCHRYEGLGPAWLVWDFDVSYIAVEDVSYFWSVTFDLPATFRVLGLPSPIPRWLSDIRQKRPFVVSKTIVDDFLPSRETVPNWWQWFLSNYCLLKAPRGDYIYWRNDISIALEDRG